MSWVYSWRKRAKPLRGRVVAAHVVCRVFCVLFVVCCVLCVVLCLLVCTHSIFFYFLANKLVEIAREKDK